MKLARRALIPATSAALMALHGLGCDAEPAVSEAAPASTVTRTDCAFPLVRLQTGPDASCGGEQGHWWPVGMEADACHGWVALDTSGRQHFNSANNILCNEDGSFSFDQYPGNLDCEGTGRTKVYVLDQCEQDTPPSLYTVAVDLTCCLNPTSAECRVGVPSVDREGSTIYLDGARCEP
jgi:hypothetical protein